MKRAFNGERTASMAGISTSWTMWIVPLLLAFLFMQASPALASGRHRGPDPERMMDHLTDELDLSPDQVEQIRPIVEENVEKRKALHEKFSAQRRDARQDMRSEMNTLREDCETKFEGVLTEEQMTKYKAFMEDKREERRERRAHRRGGRKWDRE